MKKTKFLVISFIAIFLLLSVSCKSTQSGDDDAAARMSMQQAANRFVTQAEEARKRAMDFESPAYFPSDWEKVEAQFADARAGNDEGLLTAVVEAYNELFKRALPLYAQSWEDEIMSVRNDIIRSGIRNILPSYTGNADIIALEAKAQLEAGDYYIARDTAAKALGEFEGLLVGAKVYSRRQEIVARGFETYDPEGYEKALDVASTALEHHMAGDNRTARGYAEEALVLFDQLLLASWTRYAREQRESTTAEREQAIADRVNVAMREAFREADGLFTRAEASFNSGKYEEAALLYMDAEAMFVIAGQETRRRRQRASETIRIADERIEGSHETAIEAERIIEGGVR